MKLNRNPRAVASHYYNMEKSENKMKMKNWISLFMV